MRFLHKINGLGGLSFDREDTAVSGEELDGLFDGGSRRQGLCTLDPRPTLAAFSPSAPLLSPRQDFLSSVPAKEQRRERKKERERDPRA